MKAWQVHGWGEPESMQFADIDSPEPGLGQVLIRNHAAGLNFFDILQIQGLYQVKPPFPFTPGAEVAGTVAAVGSGVEQWKPGDKVLALCFQGGFAEFSLATADRTFPIPNGMLFTEAAAMPVVFQTSYHALTDRASLQSGEWLLVHAGASGVGASAIQIGKALGAHVIATAGSEEKLEFCRKTGADEAINYREPVWVDRVRQITGGRGADVIYDPVGGDVFDLSTKCIAPLGRLLVVGFAAGRIPTIAVNRILLKSISIVGVFWGGYCQVYPDYPRHAQAALNDLYGAGKIHPPKPVEYRLSQAPRALRDLAERRVVGKAVLVPGENHEHGAGGGTQAK